MFARRSALALLVVAGILIPACRAPAPPAMPAPSPPPLPSSGVRFIVGGDSRDDAAQVLPWALREAKARQACAFVFLGDMELTPSLDGRFEKALLLLDPVPFYPVLGNHEIKTLGFLPLHVAHSERKFRARFLGTPRTPVRSSLEGRVVYSADLPGRVHFVALDNVSQNGFGSEQLSWLAADLDAVRTSSSADRIIVGMHKPLAHNGVSTHGMDADGARAIVDSDAALALLVEHRVDLIVQSHVHEFAFLTQGGIPAYITGGLGAPLDHAGPEHSFHHFLQIDLEGGALHVTVVRFDGASSVAQNGDED